MTIGHSGNGDSNTGFSFGDKLMYRSPMTGCYTPCIYLREEGERAVVVFKSAESVTRVNPQDLSRKES